MSNISTSPHRVRIQPSLEAAWTRRRSRSALRQPSTVASTSTPSKAVAIAGVAVAGGGDAGSGGIGSAGEQGEVVRTRVPPIKTFGLSLATHLESPPSPCPLALSLPLPEVAPRQERPYTPRANERARNPVVPYLGVRDAGGERLHGRAEAEASRQSREALALLSEAQAQEREELPLTAREVLRLVRERDDALAASVLLRDSLLLLSRSLAANVKEHELEIKGLHNECERVRREREAKSISLWRERRENDQLHNIRRELEAELRSYVGSNALRLPGALGIAFMERLFWFQIHCRARRVLAGPLAASSGWAVAAGWLVVGLLVGVCGIMARLRRARRFPEVINTLADAPASTSQHVDVVALRRHLDEERRQAATARAQLAVALQDSSCSQMALAVGSLAGDKAALEAQLVNQQVAFEARLAAETAVLEDRHAGSLQTLATSIAPSGRDPSQDRAPSCAISSTDSAPHIGMSATAALMESID